MTKPDSKAVREAAERLNENAYDIENTGEFIQQQEDIALTSNAFLYYHDPTPLDVEMLFSYFFSEDWIHARDRWYLDDTNLSIEIDLDGNFKFYVGDQLANPQPETAGDLRTLVERLEREDTQ